MFQNESIAKSLHNNVCPQLPLVGKFFALFRHEMSQRNIGTSQLAAMLDWHRNRVSRMFAEPGKTKADDLIAICEVLDLDLALATFAITTMGDWPSYYDPALRLSINMLGLVVTKINERRTCEIEILSPAAIEVLTDWIVRNIIDNQEQICSRRDGFAPLLRGV